MENPVDFYTLNREKHLLLLRHLKRQLALSSILRLTVFLLTAVGIYLGVNHTLLIVLFGSVGLVAFFFLLYRHGQLSEQKDYVQAIVKLNELEIEVQNRNFHHLPGGEEYLDFSHFFSGDVDLFGRGSFFQYLNRTALKDGKDFLAGLLLENSIKDIPKKQEAIKELAEKPNWRQEFTATASHVEADISSREINEWLKNYTSFIPKKMWFVSSLFSFVSVVLAVLFFIGQVSGYLFAGWFFLGVLITGIFSKKMKVFSQQISQAQSTFQQFQQLILKIEKEKFSSELLKTKKEQVQNQTLAASVSLKTFSRNLDAFDFRNVMIFGFLLNGFFLWDIHLGYKIERWIKQHKTLVPKWFEAIVFFDAYNSLGNFAFNHPNFVFPEITSEKVILEIEGAGHPLLKEEILVRNDFRIESEEFFIITGANMAGKSTFLRTVSYLIIMGNLGLPMDAKKAVYHPVKLITSMRTTDSLQDDESYFFSELKRLKFIVEEIDKDEYFIILDEILKGTNSMDKAIGSKKFVEKLVNSNSTGLIATHDLSLCEVAEEMPGVRNYYFDAQIIDDELFFDYTFKSGICKNMNASFLLKKMKIVD